MHHLGRRSLIVSAIVLLIAGGVAAGWYFFGEERRTARLLARTLSSRTGLSISIDRASTDGWRLRLRGVRVAPGPTFPLDVRVKELEAEGGVMPLIAPAGRRVSIVAVSTSVTVEPGTPAGPDAAAIERFRDSVQRFLAWPGVLSMRMLGGELRSGDERYSFDLTAEKALQGSLTLTFAVAPPDSPRALRIDGVVGAGDDGAVDVKIELAGEPPRLGGLWPNAVPRPASLAARGNFGIRRGGDVTLAGRATIGDRTSGPRVIDVDARYAASQGNLDVSRYVVDWSPGVHLEGVARANQRRATASAVGTLDGSRVESRIAYELGAAAFEGDVTLAPFDTGKVAARLGLASSFDATAGTFRAHVAGVFRESTTTAEVNATAQEIRVRSLGSVLLNGVLHARTSLGRSGGAWKPGPIESASVTLTQGTAVIATLSGSSTRRELWPVAVEARIPDLGRLGPLIPLTSMISGSGTIQGELGDRERLEFKGRVSADLERVDVLAGGGTITFSGARAAIPVAFGIEPDDRPGSLSVQRITAFGFTLERVQSSARFADGRLLLPDVQFVQAGGSGTGWVEAKTTEDPERLRLRLDAQHVDLQEMVRELAIDVAHVSGHVRYFLSAQHSTSQGLTALCRFDSEDGGDVSIDVLQHLIESAAVQAESTGLLRRTLENLRVFEYESLEGELRVAGGAGRLDVTLKGKKRFGLFPGPVDSINVKNAPLDVLARTFGGGSRP